MPKACVQRKIKMGRTMEQAMKECYPKGMKSGMKSGMNKKMKSGMGKMKSDSGMGY